MKKITNIPLKLTISIIAALYIVILYFLPLDCVILELTGIPCLGCGMTRAWISALKLDFSSAFSYHFMFFTMPLLYICFWLDGSLFKSKKANGIFYGVILLGFVLNWVYHLF